MGGKAWRLGREPTGKKGNHRINPVKRLDRTLRTAPLGGGTELELRANGTAGVGADGLAKNEVGASELFNHMAWYFPGICQQ